MDDNYIDISSNNIFFNGVKELAMLYDWELDVEADNTGDSKTGSDEYIFKLIDKKNEHVAFFEADWKHLKPTKEYAKVLSGMGFFVAFNEDDRVLFYKRNPTRRDTRTWDVSGYSILPSVEPGSYWPSFCIICDDEDFILDNITGQHMKYSTDNLNSIQNKATKLKKLPKHTKKNIKHENYKGIEL